jgi:hypothetical protein
MRARSRRRAVVLAAWLLAGLLPAVAAEAAEPPPVPPCAGGEPVPSWPTAGAPPAVGLWRMAELPPEWEPPPCSGLDPPADAVLTAVAGRFRHDGDAASLLARLGAVSTHTRIVSWSVRRQAWEPVLAEATALSAADAEARRPDFAPDELHAGARLHALYDDSEALGPVVYETEIREAGPDGFLLVSRNADAGVLMGLTVAAPGDIATMVSVQREAPGRFRYYSLTSVSLAPLAAAMVTDTSHVNRAVGAYRFLAGIPGDLEPPAVAGEPAASSSPWRLGGGD